MIILSCTHECWFKKPKHQPSRVQPIHGAWGGDWTHYTNEQNLDPSSVLPGSIKRASKGLLGAGMGSRCRDISSTGASREPPSADRHNSSRFILKQNNEALCGCVSLSKRLRNKADVSSNVAVRMWFTVLFTSIRNVQNNMDSVHSNTYVCRTETCLC